MPTNSPQWNPRGSGLGSLEDRSVLAFLALGAIGGALATASLFAGDPSMERNAIAFGYSLPRLLLGFMVGGLTTFLFAATVAARCRPSALRRLLAAIDTKASANPTRMVSLLLALLCFSIVGGYIEVLLHLSLVPGASGTLQIVVERAFWIAVWLTSLPLLLLASLIIRWRNIEGLWQRFWPVARQRLVAFLVVLFTILHWLTLGLEARWLQRVEGWFWPYTPKPIAAPQTWLLVVVLLGLALSYLVIRLPRRPFRDILISIAAAYLLQVGFGFAGGQGYESIRERYDRAGFSEEMQVACKSQVGTVAAVRNYEVMFGDYFWYGTKPPGLFMFYSLARDAVHGLYSVTRENANACQEILMGYLARWGPLLAALVVLPVLGLQGQLGERPMPLLGPLLCMSSPGMLLMLLAPDQMLFPLLAASTAFLWVAASAKRSPVIGALAGALAGIALFTSFSLIPVLGFALMFWALMLVFAGGNAERRLQLSVGLAAVVGIASILGVQALALNYNPVERWLSAMALHREIKGYEFTLGGLLQYGLLNNLEFAAWAGLPLVVLAFASIWRSLVSVARGLGRREDMFNAALLGMYLTLNVVGQTKGEVGRLWLFLVPLMAVPAAREASRLIRRPEWGAVLVLALQLTSSVAAFSRLDFR